MSMTEHKTAYRKAAWSVLVVALVTALACAAMAVIDRTTTSYDAVYLEVGDESPTYEPFTVLLIGSDSRAGTALYTGKENEASQIDQYADIMTLVRVDPIAYTITLVTVPRDTWHDNRKVNAALIDGDPLEVVSAVESLTSATIDYYILTNFIDFERLVDGLGGVTVDVPVKVTVPDPATAEDVTVRAGEAQTLDGSEALAFSRARKEYGKEQDALRQVNVREVEMSLIDSVLSGEASLPLALSLLNACTTHDIDMSLLKWVAESFRENYDLITYYSGTGPYHGGTRKSDGQWVVPSNEDTWVKLMEAVSNGEDPAAIVYPPTFD